MIKGPSGFVSAQFRSCLLVSPFGHLSDVWVWCKPMTGGPWPPFRSYRWSTVCGWFLWAWLLPGWAKLLCKAGIYQHWVQEYVSKCSKLPQYLPLPVSAFWPAVNLRRLADQTISGRASGINKGCDSWISHGRCLSDFREDGRFVSSPWRH